MGLSLVSLTSLVDWMCVYVYAPLLLRLLVGPLSLWVPNAFTWTLNAFIGLSLSLSPYFYVRGQLSLVVVVSVVVRVWLDNDCLFVWSPLILLCQSRRHQLICSSNTLDSTRVRLYGLSIGRGERWPLIIVKRLLKGQIIRAQWSLSLSLLWFIGDIHHD